MATRAWVELTVVSRATMSTSPRFLVVCSAQALSLPELHDNHALGRDTRSSSLGGRKQAVRFKLLPAPRTARGTPDPRRAVSGWPRRLQPPARWLDRTSACVRRDRKRWPGGREWTKYVLPRSARASLLSCGSAHIR